MSWRWARLKMHVRRWLGVVCQEDFAALRRKHWGLVRDLASYQREVEERIEVIEEKVFVLEVAVKRMALQSALGDIEKMEAANGHTNNAS